MNSKLTKLLSCPFGGTWGVGADWFVDRRGHAAASIKYRGVYHVPSVAQPLGGEAERLSRRRAPCGEPASALQKGLVQKADERGDVAEDVHQARVETRAMRE